MASAVLHADRVSQCSSSSRRFAIGKTCATGLRSLIAAQWPAQILLGCMLACVLLRAAHHLWQSTALNGRRRCCSLPLLGRLQC